MAEAIANGTKIYTQEYNGAGSQTTLAAKGTDYEYVTKMYTADGKALTADEAADATDEVYADANGTIEIDDKDAYLTDATVNGDLEFNLHVGADAEATNKISISIEHMSAAGLGLTNLKVNTEVDATNAIETIAQAIQKVSGQRSDLGAVQNRLEHTIANLDNVVENTTAAESRIRDTDMAKEMVEFSKTNILAQAGQSILAQANQSTQGILSLLS